MKGLVKTKNGALIYLFRGITGNNQLPANQYLPERVFKVGILNQTPSISNLDLLNPVPINSGTVNDTGETTMTGANGGNNTTNNVITFKPGAQQSDNIAQNLNVNNTSVNKDWTLTITTAIDKTKYCGLWVYLTSNSLNTLVTLDCLRVNLGMNSSNYYEKKFNKTNLTTGWNWLYLGIVEDLNEIGTVSGTINYFKITLETNNATDVWLEGEVVYDLLRTYVYNDLIKDYITDYPQLNTTNLEVTKKAYLTTIDAVGFNIDAYGDFNEDTTPLMGMEATINSRSKSDTDEIIFTVKERIIL